MAKLHQAYKALHTTTFLGVSAKFITTKFTIANLTWHEPCPPPPPPVLSLHVYNMPMVLIVCTISSHLLGAYNVYKLQETLHVCLAHLVGAKPRGWLSQGERGGGGMRHMGHMWSAYRTPRAHRTVRVISFRGHCPRYVHRKKNSVHLDLLTPLLSTVERLRHRHIEPGPSSRTGFFSAQEMTFV